MKKVRVGVIGAGYFGRFHIEKFLNLDGVELVGVVDTDPSRRQEVADRYSVKTFSHHTELIGLVQSVSIAVPTPFHYAIAKDCLSHGIDVLIEKPISTTLEEADELIALSEAHHLILQVGHLERFNGAFRAAENRIQDPFLIEARRVGPFTGRGGDVDVVLDLMVHDIDIVLHLVNANVRHLKATGSSVFTSCCDEARAEIEFENGCRALLTASRTSGERIRKTTIYQPDGVLTIDFQTQCAFLLKKSSKSPMHALDLACVEEIPVQKVDPLQEEIRSFLQSVRERKIARVSGRDGRRVLEIALSIIRKMGEQTD